MFFLDHKQSDDDKSHADFYIHIVKTCQSPFFVKNSTLYYEMLFNPEESTNLVSGIE